MSKEIFDNCTKIGMPIHKFCNNTRAIFYKGFKFEEVIDISGNVIYNSYNIRYMNYKPLSEDEVKMVLDHGVMISADVLSYKSYKKIISKYVATLENNKNGYKSIEKAKKVIEYYDGVCNNLLKIHKKHIDLFA